MLHGTTCYCSCAHFFPFWSAGTRHAAECGRGNQHGVHIQEWYSARGLAIQACGQDTSGCQLDALLGAPCHWFAAAPKAHTNAGWSVLLNTLASRAVSLGLCRCQVQCRTCGCWKAFSYCGWLVSISARTTEASSTLLTQTATASQPKSPACLCASQALRQKQSQKEECSYTCSPICCMRINHQPKQYQRSTPCFKAARAHAPGNAHSCAAPVPCRPAVPAPNPNNALTEPALSN